MENLLHKLQHDFPKISFIPGEEMHWSPHNSAIYYNGGGNTAIWGLLHEVGHAILEHKNYRNDADLLKKEIAAWVEACRLGQAYSITIEETYIEDCLDTYRDWLHKRSTCPACTSHGLEQHTGLYSCLNCTAVWRVTPSRLCRPYRLKYTLNK